MKLKLTLITIVLLSLSTTIYAQEFKITHGPYLTAVDQTSAIINWTTSKPALSWVELAPDGEDSFYASERPKYFQTVAGRKMATKTVHTVRINDLEPGTHYRYRIYSQDVKKWEGSNWVEYGAVAASDVYMKKPFRFKTLSDTPGTTSSFVMINDIHGNNDLMSNLLKGLPLHSQDFIAMNGDMANWILSEEQMFKDFIDRSVDLFAKEVPIAYIRGNHETRGIFSDEMFTYLPTKEGTYYRMFTVGDVCYLLLDSGEDKPDSDIEYGGIADFDRYREEEARWLSEVVKSKEFKEARARIAFMHIPPFTKGWHGERHINKLFVPILNEAGIDLMLCAHYHAHHYRAADREIQFPVIVNSNTAYLKCEIDNKKIKINIRGTNEKETKDFTFDLTPR